MDQTAPPENHQQSPNINVLASRYGDRKPKSRRTIRSVDAREITAGPNTNSTVLSADSRWLAYKNSNLIFRVCVTGGIPQRLRTVLAARYEVGRGRPAERIHTKIRRDAM
jgi:hypothetical protein